MQQPIGAQRAALMASCCAPVIKPIYGAASIGVVRVDTLEELEKTYVRVQKEMSGARIVAGALQQADDDEHEVCLTRLLGPGDPTLPATTAGLLLSSLPLHAACSHWLARLCSWRRETPAMRAAG